MAKQYLVIVESPGKIKKLKNILGADYEIIASMGHVMDLPPKAFGIDLEKMQGDYVVLKADVAKRLRSEAAINGRTLKEGHPKFSRPGLKKLKEKLKEAPGQNWPKEWDPKPVLPEQYRP